MLAQYLILHRIGCYEVDPISGLLGNIISDKKNSKDLELLIQVKFSLLFLDILTKPIAYILHFSISYHNVILILTDA